MEGCWGRWDLENALIILYNIINYFIYLTLIRFSSTKYRIKSTLHCSFRRHYQHLLLLHFDYLNLSAFLHLLLRDQISLQLLNRIIIELHSDLHSGPLDRSRGQVQFANYALSAHVDPICLCEYYRLCYFLSVGLVATAMLDLDVQVQRALRAVELLALLVRALEASLDVVRTAPVVLLAARAIALGLESVQVLVVKALDFVGLGEQIVSIVGKFVQLREKGLVLKVKVPVLVHIVEGAVVNGEFWEACSGI